MKPERPLLVIDDDAAFSAVLVRSLRRRGLDAEAVSDPVLAVGETSRLGVERIVLDLNLGGVSGLGLIRPLLAASPEARIVVLTGYASIATAIDAIKLGAKHYLSKPVDIDALLAAFDLSAPVEPATPASFEPPSVSRVEWEHIQQVLHAHGGNISATARALRMHRRTLQRKLGKHPVAG